MKKLFAVLLMLFLLSITGFALAEQTPIQTPPEITARQELDLTTLYTNVTPSVVYIEVLARGETLFGDGLAQGVGSGFVVDTQGYIVTNFHVVDGAQRIVVTFFDGSMARAEVIGLDPDSDLAVIKVNVDPGLLRPVSFANSSELRVGQTVVAIGNPFEQSWTMTTGIISALGRNNPATTGFNIAEMIQTDAAINPGNSGGPLLDLQGRVIGVNTMIFTESSVNSGIGFAVPSNTVQRVYPFLISQGFYQYTWVGIQGTKVTLDIRELMGLDPSVRGVLVTGIIPNGPASRAGLRGNTRTGTIDGLEYAIGGDVIVAINGAPVQDMNALVNYLAVNTEPGEQITLTVIRDGNRIDLPVLLEARPE